jgi:DNA (cytosine-5)-methyltransferase 1
MVNFTYKWNLTDLENVPKNGLNVFSCFSCGGGSTMGYKMSGFNVIGCNEIDPEMMEIYKKNHNPKYSFLESIETFKLRDDLPKELYNLDILDGSPPCSSFSMAGSREKTWGKKKKFREGQADQVLDDLFFHYIELARKLQPKVVIAENVKGMLQGNAKGYVKQIINLFNVAGYDVQPFLLNGATMGLPQKRERVFFVCKRKDLDFPKLKLGFNEKPIPFREVYDGVNYPKKYCEKRYGDVLMKPHQPSQTLVSANRYFYPKNFEIGVDNYKLLGSFPMDYTFKSDKIVKYQIGMSVPPLMMHKISREIYKQWFKINATRTVL